MPSVRLDIKKHLLMLDFVNEISPTKFKDWYTSTRTRDNEWFTRDDEELENAVLDYANLNIECLRHNVAFRFSLPSYSKLEPLQLLQLQV